jgi:RNA polymerase sigma factor (sigma-70 family)
VVAALRTAAAPALAAVIRRVGDLDDAEDAMQEAMAAAAVQWARDGVPAHPVGWLVTVATRRAVDAIRSDAARRDREVRARALEPADADVRHTDDELALFLLCAHPALSRPQQIALTLRAVGGLTTREIARGLLLTETAAGQRISRAKAVLRRDGVRFALPDAADLPARAQTVVDVLGVIHTEAHTAAEGEDAARPALAAEALRLARALLAITPARAPWRGEVLGLVALMLFTAARAPARIDSDGALVPLAEQDRMRWLPAPIAEGEALLTEALTQHPVSAHPLRAAIAGVHAAAASWDDTDFVELLGLYDLLGAIDPSPVVALGRVVALAGVAGADAALRELETVADAAPPARVAAVRAHLLQRAGRDARDAYRAAATLTRNAAERRWLRSRAGE